jgi:hypothetical protein
LDEDDEVDAATLFEEDEEGVREGFDNKDEEAHFIVGDALDRYSCF